MMQRSRRRHPSPWARPLPPGPAQVPAQAQVSVPAQALVPELVRVLAQGRRVQAQVPTCRPGRPSRHPPPIPRPRHLLRVPAQVLLHGQARRRHSTAPAPLMPPCATMRLLS